VDPKIKKQVLNLFQYGIYICTSKSEGQISSSSITWVTQSSFHPPLLAMAVKVETGIYETIKSANQFALHVVPEDGKELARRFFRPAHVEDGRINGVPFEVDEEYDLPILLSAPAYLIGSVQEIIKMGDHHIFIAEVIDAVVKHSTEPILLRDTGWSYSG